MFMSFSLDRWIGLIQYFIIVFALFTGVYFASVKATYICFDRENKRNKVKVRRKVQKKQVFFDVA